MSFVPYSQSWYTLQTTWKDKIGNILYELEQAKKISEKEIITKSDMDEIDKLLGNVSWDINKEFWSMVYCEGCGEASTKRIDGCALCDGSECYKNVIGNPEEEEE